MHWIYIFLAVTHLYDKTAKQPVFLSQTQGARLNKKDGLTRYGNSHVKDKTS